MVTERPRMNRLRTVASVAALALLVLSGTACKQGAGDRCELDSDCASGLVCSKGNQVTVAESGICVSKNPTTAMDAAVVDTGAGGGGGGGGNDATTSDTAPDQAADSSTGDAPDDTSTSDVAGGSDTATTTDTAFDTSVDATVD